MKLRNLDPRTWTLGAKIGVTLVLAALVPMAVLSFYATRAGQDAVEKSELANAQGAALVGASAVTEYLDGVSRRAEQFGTASDVVAYINDPTNTPQPSFGAAKSSPDVRSILVIDAKGNVVSGIPPSSVGKSFNTAGWFVEAISGKTAVGDVEPDADSGRYIITVASPARRPGQAVVGAVSIGVSSEDVMFALSQSPLIPGGQAVLVDDGRVIAARDSRYQGRTLDDLGLGSVARKIENNSKGTIAKVPLVDRGEQVVAWATTRTGATAMVIEPRSVFLDPIDSLARNTRIALVVVGVIALLAAVFVARRLSRPVRALTLAAQAIEAEQEPDAEALARLGRSRDDVGRLARVFTRMAEQVAVRERKLREQVKALRVEIDQERRKQSVEEVVDSDFFRELESRAAQIRQRMKTGTADGAGAAEGGDGDGATDDTDGATA